MPKLRTWQKFRPLRRLASYDPHPHQMAFHQDTHKYRALVTGVGGGKTRMGVEEIIKWTQLYPGCLLIIGRLTAKSLKETTQRRFFEVCPPEIIEEYNQTDEHVWIRTNATFHDPESGKDLPVYSEILFIHLDNPGPLGSLDISGFWIDEAHEPDGTEVPEATFEMLMARLRHPVGPHRGFVTSNSGGKDWVWSWFWGPKCKKEFKGWTASSEANAKYLPEGYVEELRRNHSDVWVKRFVDASFDAFAGQIFHDFDEAVHCYHSLQIEIASSWDHGCGFDFGVGAPTSVEYGAIDRDDDLYIYDEYYMAEAAPEEVCNHIKARGFSSVYADPSVVNRGPNKKSPKQIYQEHGVNLIPASNDEDYFLKLFIEMLRKRHKDGSAVLHINADRCPNLVNQIKQAAWDPLTLNGTTHDKMKKMENHALDAFKYFMNMYGLHPGLLSPVMPGNKTKEVHMVNGNWEHESMWEDEDIDKDDYPFPEIKREVV